LLLWHNRAINVTRQLPPKETAQMTTSIPQEQTKSAPAMATTKARVAKPRPHAGPTKAKPARRAPRAKKAAPARSGTKTGKILELLKRPGGVTLKDLMKATGWQAHSVRGFLSGALAKKTGTPAESFKGADGQRTYRLSSK
jgi:hypothetical protein